MGRLKKKDQELKHINILFLILALLLFTTGSILQYEDAIHGILITEYIIVLTLPLAFSIYYDIPVKEIFSFRKLEIADFMEVFVIVLLAYPILLLLHGSAGLSFRETVTYLPVPKGRFRLLQSWFLFAFTPAVCEEIAFRGVFQQAYRHRGKEFAILISAFSFAVFHRYLFQFPHSFVLGLMLASVAWEKGLWLSIWGHFVYNSLGLLFNISLGGEEMDLSYLSHMQTIDAVLLSLMGIGLVLLCTIILYQWKKPQWDQGNFLRGMKMWHWKIMWPFVLIFVLYFLVNV